MKKKLHIIITSEEGRPKSFVICKRKLIISVQISAALLLLLTLASIASVNFFFKSSELQTQLSSMENELGTSLSQKQNLEKQLIALGEEKEALLNDAVSELNQKSKLIESILTTVGVDIKTQESKSNSGGPYTTLDNQNPEDLLFKADRYLETIQLLPLGTPVAGVITSKFGRRVDPLNQKPAFHEGVDIRGRRGTDIKATADGIVSKRGHNSGYGWYLEINHQNGFKTKFGHLKKILVNKGEKVTRGQTIALLGNSGRSTGPHVHYELIHNNKVVNPYRFMEVGRILKKTVDFSKKANHKKG